MHQTARIQNFRRLKVPQARATFRGHIVCVYASADRNFYSHAFWQRAVATATTLLFRVKRNLRLPRKQELADGSYLTTLHANDQDRRNQRNGTVVRVIEYTLDGIRDPEPSYRLITNWLECAVAPGVELAAQATCPGSSNGRLGRRATGGSGKLPRASS